jgi:glycosyltransferase involved in cell wall biosynthesis
MKAAILYSSLFSQDGEKRTIGGIETYLVELARLCGDMGIAPTIYQWSQQPFARRIGGIAVRGVPVLRLPYGQRPLALFRAVSREIDTENDLVIFGSDAQSVRSHCKRTVSIQHGVSWDLPARFLTAHALLQGGPLETLYKAWTRRRFVDFFTRCPNRVCVDYNFPNWYRTYLVGQPRGRDWVIPNFAEIASAEQIRLRWRDDRVTNVLFARRYCEFRGTRIVAEAAQRALHCHPDLHFTFAGEGPDEQWLRDFFATESRVRFIKYSPEESLDVHLRHHVAIIPSLASEGTSLSVAEAMGAACAIVATAVGGITNMIIDGYNGLLVSPCAPALSVALEQLVRDRAQMRRLGTNAYNVAAESFSLIKWRTRWREVIETISSS